MKINNRGQLSIINMVFYVVIVLLGAVFTPILAESAALAANASNSTMGTIVAQAIVPLFWIGIVLTFFIYVVPVGIGRQ